MTNKIAIITLCIGPDYTKAMEPLLESKRNYANKHGYDFIIGGKDVWDRHRPVQWSKFNIIQKHLYAYDWIFWTDADSIILNDTIKLETFINCIPPNKDILWTIDACNHLNNGHMFIRGKSAWAHDFFNRAYSQTQYLHHIWWDNAAMIELYKHNPTDYLRIETITSHWLFNAYIFGPNETADDPTARLYQQGDFLVHFAGVYAPLNIYRMAKYLQHCTKTNTSHDKQLLNKWRMSPPISLEVADQSIPQ
jgi:hypothetical protein